MALAVAALVADHVELDEYVLTPGQAQAVGPLIKVPASRAHRVNHSVLLTDVFVTQVTALSYLPDRLDGNAQMVSAETLLGPSTPPDQMLAQGYLEMAQSQAAAKAVALTRLGYPVTEHATGALIFAVQPGSPASRVLRVGQVVTKVDGIPTPGVCPFVSALASLRPGDVADLTVQRDRVTSQAVQVRGATVHERVRLAGWPRSAGAPPATTSCPAQAPAPKQRAYLGVEVDVQEHFQYPFPITIKTTTIGGPSAGLAMALGVVESLTGDHLTGGHTVAATGTIDQSGDVGDVGGVPQKTVAVERAGATVFFVPTDNLPTALSKATPALRVYGVTSLGQVLADLHRLGGHVPANHQAPSHAS